MASDGASTHVALRTSTEQSVDPAMVQKTSKALLKHLQESKPREDGHQKSRNLLELDGGLSEEAIWLIISTKKHITKQKRLKTTKISIPHSLNTSSTLSICLIVPDPQRLFKDIVAHLACTSQSLNRITRVIDIKKLEKKYHSFESKRKLKASYDLFLVDDRINTYLPKILGKTFFSSTSKRPIPVCLRPRKAKQEKGNAFLPIAKSRKDDPEPTSIIGAQDFRREIERTLSTTTANLSPSSTTSVRVGNASFTPDQLAANAEAIIEAMVNRSIPQKWRGLKAIHMKGPNSMALPVYLAEEMWEDEADVLEDAEVQRRRLESSTKKRKLETLGTPPNNSMRTMEGNLDTSPDQSVVKIKARKIDTKKLDQETKEQKEQLRQHRREVREKLNNPRQRSQVMAVS